MKFKKMFIANKLKLTFVTFSFFTFCLESFAKIPSSNSEEYNKKDYFVKSKGYSSNPDTDPPEYVYQLNETGIKEFENIDYIDAGLNYRMRFEHRRNDFRRINSNTDNVFLSRTQAYFGIKNIIDPLRFSIELQDSRSHNSKFAKNTGDVNKLDIFQSYVELYFKKPQIVDRPISIKAGRMSFEVMDRKLLARDYWGNTGTNFDGFRITIGNKNNDWQIDNFALKPVIKDMSASDNNNKNQWFYGSVLNWRKFSDFVTIQPFYFQLNQKQSEVENKRRIYSPGLRFYGTIANNIDYDFLGVYQSGENGNENHRAYAYSTEIGYSFLENNWQPRLSLVYGYASGDKNPNDNKNQRFERFFGFNRPWSNINTIEWENLETIKSRIELKPNNRLALEGSYSHYWLASASDYWKRTDLHDTTGSNGKEIGQDFDFRMHYKLSKHLESTIGYAHFVAGDFTKNVGRNGSSDFIYLELTFNIFGHKN